MNSQNDLILCIIIGVVMLLLIAMSIVLLCGKGAWLIAGYNSLSKNEKEQYDSAALCKFIGKYLLSISLLMPAIPIGAIFKIDWLIAVYVFYMMISTISVMAYCNTGNHFRK